jgi:hypothetical protein
MSNERSGFAAGLSVFAGVMLLLAGSFQMLAGLAAIFKGDAHIYAQTSDTTYYLHLSTGGWGWLHLLIGLVVFLAGLGIFAGQVWARTVGVIIAAVSAVANFAFIPIAPFWAIVIIVIDIFVIWALTAHGRDITE